MEPQLQFLDRQRMLSGNICITGGAGFLGRGIFRRAKREHWPVQFSIISRDDHKHKILQQLYPEVTCIRGDVTGDIDYLKSAFVGHDIVIHAAACKHVDLSEANVFDTHRVNVVGTQQVLFAAAAAGVKQVVLISTDKATMPVNTYGMTKALAERMVTEIAIRGILRANSVRYGNVVGSTGSVIPLFRKQLHEQGKVFLTDPNMTRFWMSVDEAIDLILIALNHASPGSTSIPLTKAMRMSDVVKAIGGEDVEIEIIGERPGERKNEYLIHAQESIRVLKHFRPDFYEIMPSIVEGTEIGSFTLRSDMPSYWMEIDEMRRLIDDAEEV